MPIVGTQKPGDTWQEVRIFTRSYLFLFLFYLFILFIIFFFLYVNTQKSEADRFVPYIFPHRAILYLP